MSSSSNEKVSGTVDRLIYRSPENSWSVLLVSTSEADPNDSRQVVVTGISDARESQSIEAVGRWVVRKGERQLEASTIVSIMPATEDGITAYLASGVIKGIGAKKAQQIVAAFGAETLAILDHTPERLAEVKGFSKRTAAKIAQAWIEQAAQRRILLFLHENKIPAGLARRIHKALGDDAITKISANPYTLATEVRGIGFKTADDIALRMGVHPLSPFRAKAALVHVAETRATQGHTGTPRDVLLAQTAELLDAGAADQAMLVAAQALAESTSGERPLLLEDAGSDVVWLSALRRCEDRVAEFVSRRAGKSAAWGAVSISEIKRVAESVGMSLAQQQAQALDVALNSRLSIITGGPGVGKTATTRVLLRVLSERRLRVLLAAPTGKAAQRASEATGVPASTIHRMLNLGRAQDEPGTEGQQPEHLEADAVIVDESSMLDAPLAAKLCAAIAPRTALILIGDVDQLPSVGPGRVLADLIESGKVPVARLTQVFRQAAGSLIITNAHRINSGEMPVPGKKGEDFFVLDESRYPELGSDVAADAARFAAEKVVELAARLVPAKYGFDPVRDVQVLCPMNNGDVGVAALNRAMQEAINPRPSASVSIMGQRVGVGDKVIQTRNNYNLNVFNGDMGVVADIDPENKTVLVSMLDGREVLFSEDEADDLKLAYAMTIHKSQGSQAQAVIIPMVTQNWIMLQRNLIYTGVTRAQKLALIVGQSRAIARAVRHNEATKRLTSLPGLLA